MNPTTKILSNPISQLSINTTCKNVIITLAGAWLVWGAALSPSAVQALEFQCEIPDDTRYLKVEIPGEEHLCEVSVTYAQTGVREVKWYAQNDTMFCSARAYELRNKYQDAWNYTCTTWPDRDGIDKLSQSQRRVLDQRLKTVIAQGQTSTPAYSVSSVKAVASTPLDNQAGKLAFQYFTDQGDFTEIVENDNNDWTVLTTIDDLVTHVVSDVPISSALVHAIDEMGTLEVHTRLTDADNARCFGSQVLTPMGSSGVVRSRTPHRFICQSSNLTFQDKASTEATTGNDETVTQ